MASVPLPINQVEDIIVSVARNLLEKWAIEDRFTVDEMDKAVQNAVEDTAFVVNNFMEHFNEFMLTASEESKPNLII